MNNFDLRKFLTENKLTKVSKLTETSHSSVDPVISNEVYNMLKAYDDTYEPELGDWRQDPTHVLEQTIEILEENGIEVPSGMFHDRMYQAVDELVRHTRDLQFIADNLIEFVLDPSLYQEGMAGLNEEQKSDLILFPLDISDTPRNFYTHTAQKSQTPPTRPVTSKVIKGPDGGVHPNSPASKLAVKGVDRAVSKIETPRIPLNESGGAPGTLTFKYDGFDPTGDKDYEAGEVGGSLMYYSDDFPDEGTLFLEIGADASLDSSEIFRLYPDQVKVYFKNVSMNEDAFEPTFDSGYKFIVDDGEDVSELDLSDYPDLDTALYDVVQDLASTYNGSVREYLTNVREESQYGSFKNLQELLDYEVDKAGGMERVLQNGLHLIMPGTAMDEVFIKITPSSTQ